MFKVLNLPTPSMNPPKDNQKQQQKMEGLGEALMYESFVNPNLFNKQKEDQKSAVEA